MDYPRESPVRRRPKPAAPGSIRDGRCAHCRDPAVYVRVTVVGGGWVGVARATVAAASTTVDTGNAEAAAAAAARFARPERRAPHTNTPVGRSLLHTPYRLPACRTLSFRALYVHRRTHTLAPLRERARASSTPDAHTYRRTRPASGQRQQQYTVCSVCAPFVYRTGDANRTVRSVRFVFFRPISVCAHYCFIYMYKF